MLQSRSGRNPFSQEQGRKKTVARDVQGQVNFVDDVLTDLEDDALSAMDNSDDYLFEDDESSITTEDDDESHVQLEE